MDHKPNCGCSSKQVHNHLRELKQAQYASKSSREQAQHMCINHALGSIRAQSYTIGSKTSILGQKT